MKLQFKLLSVVGAFLLLQGCSATLTNQEAFERLRQRQGMGHFYYIGSEGDYHYFTSSYFMEPIRHFRYPKSKFSIQNEIPKTRDRDKWVRFIVDWADKTQYFKGEPREPLVIPDMPPSLTN